MTLIL